MKDMEPKVISAKLQVGDGDPVYFVSYTWLDFMIKINQFMDDNNWISFPLGEDDKMEIVAKKATDVEKFR